jgi:uncharacterized protein (DUF1330 family)
VSANSAHLAPEANFPSLPNYQWQFLSPSEKAAVDASVGVIMGQRIMNVTLNVADVSGVPYTGTARVKQYSTSFIQAVGSPSGNWTSGNEFWGEYLALTPSRTYGIGADWSREERVRGTFDFSQDDFAYGWAAQKGMVDFHLGIGPGPVMARWKCPGCASLPGWAWNLDYDSLKSAIQEYDEALVSHFKGRIQYYELWEEVNGEGSNNNWPLEHIIGIIKTEAFTIRSTDPSARIIVDLEDLLPKWEDTHNWTIEHFVEQLLASGVPFDIIGDETEYGNYWPGAGIDTLYNRLISIARFGKPIYIWEDSYGSYTDPAYVGQLHTWHDTPPSEDAQAEYMVAETLVYLGNPAVLGVGWWALQDYPSDHFHRGVISYPDGARKKSFYAMDQLWNNLMVNETIQCVNGVAAFRGLAGEYSISVEGYEPAVIHVSDGEPNTFSLVLRSLALRDQASQMLLKVGLNLTATSGGVALQSSEAKNLLNQSFDEYQMAEQMFQSKDYAGVLQHAQKALDLIHEAQTKETQYQEQQLSTRIAEIAVAVTVSVGCAFGAAFLRRFWRRRVSRRRERFANTFSLEEN